MGLPLFVEPAKPVSSNKNSAKDGTIYPSHHPELRIPASRSEIRDRRNGIRRAGVRIYGPMQRTTRNSRDRSLPWVESPREQDRADASATDRRSGMFREALREMTGSDHRRRERLEERMSSLFGANWRGSPPSPPSPPPPPPPPGAGEAENMTEGVDLGWWSVEPPLPPPRAGRSERQQTAASEYAAGRHSPDYESTTTLPSLFGRPMTRVETTLPHVVPLATRDRPSPRLGNMARNQPRLVRSLSARQQMPTQRATRGVDGLGDRDRSLSPEVWDTLLSTLTPDPQPPSAGSSFASVAASQTAGPSSSTGTPTTAPGIVDEVQVETVCESGCECSDNEMDTADYEHPDYLRIRRRRQEVRDGQVSRDVITSRVPDYNLDGMSEPYLGNMGSMDAEPFSMVAVPSSQRTRNPGEGRTTRRVNASNGSLTIYESTMRLPPSADSSRQSASRSTQHPTWDEPLPPRQGVSAQEAGRIAVDGPQQNQETVTSAGPSPAEDDWAGMQRIVRSLARREDIPDGWWAEAGLSRILRQGANSLNQNGSRSNDMF